MIRVLIIDDHEMFAETLVRLLSDDPNIEVLGAAATASGGLERARADPPDIVLMDFGLPDMTGAAATRLLKTMCPDTKVITLTGSEHLGAYNEAVEAGSVAWVRKTRAVHDLVIAVHRVHGGEVLLADELSDLPTPEQLVVFYQPIVEIAGDVVAGFEALVRWQHPERGLLPPSDFLPRAEETGFINEIGRTVGSRACSQLVEWKRQIQPCPPLWVSVNVSGNAVKRPTLTREIAYAIETSGVRPEDLVLEVTENILLDDADAALAQLLRLKALGVQLALDDFGTGYSSLSYLRRYPFDHVKLDISFTAELPQSTRAMRMAEAIHQLVSALNMTGIAEGVERPEQAQALRDVGWEYAQGFLYSKPVDAAAAGALIQRPPTLVRAAAIPEQPARERPRAWDPTSPPPLARHRGRSHARS